MEENLGDGPRGTVLPVRVDREGKFGPTRGEARGPRWRRTSHGLYVPAEVDADRVEQRVVEAAARLPVYGAVTGWAGLAWLGSRWITGSTADGTRRPVDLVVMHQNVRSQPEVRVSEERLAPRDITACDGVRITTTARSVCFEMRYAATWRQAVVAMDMAAYDDLVSVDEVQSYADEHSGWTGIPQCRKALAYADENSWSPQETLMRLIWMIDAERPRPWCNVPIFDADGRHVLTPDLLDPVSGVIGEYDGSVHLTQVRRDVDVRREGRARHLGLEVVTMTARDIREPGDFIRRLHDAYAAADRPRAFSWTIEPPEHWVATRSVSQRRALDDSQRRRLLRYRSG